MKDIRLPEIYEVLYDEASRLNPVSSSSDKGIEMHLQVAKELSGSSSARGVLSLAINHSHCIASYDLEEVKEWETLQRDPRLCRIAPNRRLVFNPTQFSPVNRRRRLYWNFVWTHPCHAAIPTSALPEANDALLWYIVR